MKTNIGGQFLKLIDKHFGEKRKDNLQKVLNRKTVKVGYSCTKNMGSIIKDHNRKLLDKTEYEEENSEEIKKNAIVEMKKNAHYRRSVLLNR